MRGERGGASRDPCPLQGVLGSGGARVAGRGPWAGFNVGVCVVTQPLGRVWAAAGGVCQL